MPTLGIILCAVPFILRADVIDHIPQMIVRGLIVGVEIEQVILWELQDNRGKDEQFANDFIEQLAVEAGDFIVVLCNDIVLGHMIVKGDSLGDVEHFNILLDACVPDPATVLAVTEIFAFGEIAWEATFFFERFFEECVPNAELFENTRIVDAGIDYRPETDSMDSISKVSCESLFATGFVKPGQVDFRQRCP